MILRSWTNKAIANNLTSLGGKTICWNFSYVCRIKMTVTSPPSQTRTTGERKHVKHSIAPQENVGVLSIFIYKLDLLERESPWESIWIRLASRLVGLS